MKKLNQATLSIVALSIALLASGQSDAADLTKKPIYKAPPAAAPAWSWTGLYVGGHVGGGWGDKWWDSTGQTLFGFPLGAQDIGQNLGTTSVDGFLGGAQIGFNYQSGLLVWGVEADASWTDMKGKFACPSISGGASTFSTCSSKIDWIGTVVGRVGVAVDHALVYAGAGAAWSREKDHLDCTDDDCGFPFSRIFSWDGAKTTWGWTFLAGVEYAIDNHWSAKLQYNFYDFEDGTVHLTPNQATGCFSAACSAFDVATPLRIHAIKAGINYRFDWGGPAVSAMAYAPENPKAAYAADLRMPVKAPPLVRQAWSWTGLYVGGHLGAGWGNKWWDSTGQNLFDATLAAQDVGQNIGTTSAEGFLAGGQIGFNYQTGLLVLGVEADASWSDVKGKFSCPAITGGISLNTFFSTCSSRVDWLGTVVGRVGVTVDRALVYAGGGLAWSHEKDHLDCTEFDCGSPGTRVFTWDGANTKSGWTFLTGVEYAIDNHWSAKLQYNYYEFNDGSVHLSPNQATGCFTASGACRTFDVATLLRMHSIKAGLNYRFDWGGSRGPDATLSQAAPVQVSWTGLYVGGHVGAGWGDKWWDSTGRDAFGSAFAPQDVGQAFGTTSVDGFLGGGQVGLNYQTGRLVFGVEGDASATGMKGKFPCAVIAGVFDARNLFSTCSSRVDWIATVVGRVGMTVDRALIYVGGGGAWSHEKDHIDCTDGDCGSPFTRIFTWDGAKTKSGWTFLAGAEYAIDSHWSAKLQYNLYDFGDASVTMSPNQPTGCFGPGGGCGAFDVSTRLRMHTIKAGLNYKFDWGGPVVARY